MSLKLAIAWTSRPATDRRSVTNASFVIQDSEKSGAPSSSSSAAFSGSEPGARLRAVPTASVASAISSVKGRRAQQAGEAARQLVARGVAAAASARA